MDDPILQPEPETPSQPPPAPQAVDSRFDRLEQAMSQLTQTVADAANRLTAAPPPAAPIPADQFLNELASNPQQVIQREAALAFQQAAQSTLNPAVLKVLDTANRQILESEKLRVDMEFGEGTFDEVYRPHIEQEVNQLRQIQPQAIADHNTIRALVDRRTGGESFAMLSERRAALQKSYANRGLSHMLPGGGVPRLRKGQDPQEEVPQDVEQFVRHVDRQTGENTDLKHFAKLYHTGVESGPGRHRTSVIDYLKATGADKQTLEHYGGERGSGGSQ